MEKSEKRKVLVTAHRQDETEIFEKINQRFGFLLDINSIIWRSHFGHICVFSKKISHLFYDGIFSVILFNFLTILIWLNTLFGGFL